MLTISEKANPNYLAKVVQLENIRKHPNGDYLQLVDIDFQTVVTGMDANNGDIYIFFPVECCINADFLSKTNSFRNKELNIDPNSSGFFEDKGRVRAMKLRGQKSMGYIVPINTVLNWADTENRVTINEELINQEFDTVDGIQILKKYEVPSRIQSTSSKQGKKPNISRIIDGQVHLHVDTKNLRKNAHMIKPDDVISITYKTHGTSWWVGNVMNKKHLSRTSRVMKWLGVDVNETEYDLIYGSRRVVKNSDLKDPKQQDHYFGYDLWKGIKDEIGHLIPKGFTLYGEMLGYDRNGKMIQKGFDYGCTPLNDDKPTHKLEVYRITNTNSDGSVTELSYPEIKEFCDRVGLQPPHLLFYGKAKDWSPIKEDSHWNEAFVKALEYDYNDKNCFMCDNKVPEEGIVVRKESLYDCESYKLKSFKFLEFETKELDKGEVDLESEN